MTLVESMIAILILLVGLLTMAHVLTFRLLRAKHMAGCGKSTAAAQDKIEELVGLQFQDTTTDVTVSPAAASRRKGPDCRRQPSLSSNPYRYADYVTATCKPHTANNAAYTRQWQITNNSATLKTIAVSVRSNKSMQFGTAPSTVLITQKAP
jgi:hypothetical protein